MLRENYKISDNLVAKCLYIFAMHGQTFHKTWNDGPMQQYWKMSYTFNATYKTCYKTMLI